MIPSSWTPHRRPGDDELVGYLVDGADGTVPVTLFGAPLADPGDRDTAAVVLEREGLASLAMPWLLHRDDGNAEPVAVLAAYPDRVLVSPTPYGFVDPTAETVVLDVPEGASRLRPLR